MNIIVDNLITHALQSGCHDEYDNTINRLSCELLRKQKVRITRKNKF